MNRLAAFLAEETKKETHWIWPVAMVALAILIVVKGVFAIRNKRVRLKYGRVKEGKTAVVYGSFFVVVGIAVGVIAVVVYFTGPLV